MDSRLAIAAVFLSFLGIIFAFELTTIATARRLSVLGRQRVNLFRQLVAPLAIGLLGVLLIPIVFAGKNGESPPTEKVIRCDATEIDADVGGDGIRIAIWAQEAVLLLIAVLGTFHSSATGAKEIGAGLAITHISLAVALLVQAGRGTLTSANAIVGSMILDSQSSALSIQLVAKETLAARWQVGVILACQIFGLAVLATFVNRFNGGAYSTADCECIAVFWWAWLSDCSAFATREVAIWWTYYACRCLVIVQCFFHSASNTFSFHFAEKYGRRLRSMTYPEMAARPAGGKPPRRSPDGGGHKYEDYPSTVTLMYTAYGVFAVTSIASAETAMRESGLRPSSNVVSVGQIIALVVAGATIVRAFWLLVRMFVGSSDTGTSLMWPFSYKIAKEVAGITPRPPPYMQRAQGDPPQRDVICGPLLNFRRMEGTRWFGSVLVVTKGGSRCRPFTPAIQLSKAGQNHGNDAVSGGEAGASVSGRFGATQIAGTCLYSDPRYTFWAFDLALDVEAIEVKWEYSLLGVHQTQSSRPSSSFFFVPAKSESMRIMFYSCNGFSPGTDEEALSMPALWNDALRRHLEVPFHVMIGGGSQIYHDSIRISGPLRHWGGLNNPKRRREHPFPSELRDECDDYYLKNYIMAYTSEQFTLANSQIPQLNIWGDHDIIKGYGSYANSFMRCDVLRGIGSIAYKYYMLFQHHLPPPPLTYSTDDFGSVSLSQGDIENAGRWQILQQQHETLDVYVAPQKAEPSYVSGRHPGPYITEHSRSIYARLGARIAFLGVDTRTERTMHHVNYPDTYDAIFFRLSYELDESSRSGMPIQHLLLLLGTPIAYPRLNWLEDVLKRPLVRPIHFLNRLGIGRRFFNAFDASSDLLDDLDTFYASKEHKIERESLIERLQEIAVSYSVRITILSGEVQAAAVGLFYTNPDLNITTEHDHRYMLNVISSAIVNQPLPHAAADFIARRNHVHHLNSDTDEVLLSMSNKEPGDSVFTARDNNVIIPSRNYTAIYENSPNNAAPPLSPRVQVGQQGGIAVDGDNKALHASELSPGTEHKAAGLEHGRGSHGSLDVRIFVETDRQDPAGHTEPYGFTVAALIAHGDSGT